MKGKRKWSEMMQDIVQARADLRAAIGKTDEIKDSINHDLEPEHRVLSEDP